MKELLETWGADGCRDVLAKCKQAILESDVANDKHNRLDCFALLEDVEAAIQSAAQADSSMRKTA
jgi:hypothetical protein